MHKPRLYEGNASEEMITSFGGYDKNAIIPESFFSDTLNTSSDKYPLLSPRNKRAFFNASGDDIECLFAKNKLCYIKNNSLYYGGERVNGIYLPDIQRERRMVSMGARLLIFPDGLYINTADLSDYGSLEAEFSNPQGVTVTASLSMADSTLYGDYVISSASPENAKNGDIWLDTSVTPNTLRQFSSELGIWVELAETYVKISCANIGADFSTGDGVLIEGFSDENLNGSFIIRDKGNDFITVSGIIRSTVSQQTTVTVSRKLPKMDFVTQSGNRLWGCNSEKNEIYASKLGDPKNFNCFAGISTDSYAVSVGTDGEFTGCIAFRGYVLFFKEACLHKIYGQNPPFSLSTAYLRGVQKGSEKSLVILNESLYYKSVNGVCVYEGGMPVSVSEALGSEYYTDAVAGALGDKYYICLSDKNKRRFLFVYDESKNIWHKEDEIDIRAFATHNYNLYFISQTQNGRRLCLADGENCYGNFTGELSGYFKEDKLEWSCETGLWGLSLPENKYYSKIILRIAGEEGARLWIDAQINSNGKWTEQLSCRIEKTGSVTLPFTLPRCDHVRLRIRGKGEIVVFSIARTVQTGSELNV